MITHLGCSYCHQSPVLNLRSPVRCVKLSRSETLSTGNPMTQFTALRGRGRPWRASRGVHGVRVLGGSRGTCTLVSMGASHRCGVMTRHMHSPTSVGSLLLLSADGGGAAPAFNRNVCTLHSDWARDNVGYRAATHSHVLRTRLCLPRGITSRR